MMLLSTGHKTTAADHPNPTFSPDGTKIQIQSAMLSADNRSVLFIYLKSGYLKSRSGYKFCNAFTNGISAEANL